MHKAKTVQTSSENFRAILNKCTNDDFIYLCKVLQSYLPIVKDNTLDVMRMKLEQYPEVRNYRQEFIVELDARIRYFGSSDLGYLKRRLIDNEAGVCASAIVNDVYKKLKVHIKKGPASIESRLKRLVHKVVESELFKMNPHQLSTAFEEVGLGGPDQSLIMEKIKQNGKVAILPAFVQIVGEKVTLHILETIVVSLIAQLTGKEAAAYITKEMLKRNPWINAFGPVVWVISGSWFAYDIQGPAYRKTVPVCLYLGMVALRKSHTNLSENPDKQGLLDVDQS